MSQTETRPWVLISNIKDDVNEQDLRGITPQVASLVDD